VTEEVMMVRVSVRVQIAQYTPVEFDSGEHPTPLECYEALEALMAVFPAPPVQQYLDRYVRPALEHLRTLPP